MHGRAFSQTAGRRMYVETYLIACGVAASSMELESCIHGVVFMESFLGDTVVHIMHGWVHRNKSQLGCGAAGDGENGRTGAQGEHEQTVSYVYWYGLLEISAIWS
ncbi:hypothetical protein GUJ93_ZPchr0011g28379 [Zizania palustris]|uniref:Uncharacterized protein n=1 Tax=Zizania palustris TaxID=103762 RepID=A0A8J5WJP9_ZIZPA|nr:hypothetical protein GUJ93_ZPchr0011g28379 [Zizania palustris]